MKALWHIKEIRWLVDSAGVNGVLHTGLVTLFLKLFYEDNIPSRQE